MIEWLVVAASAAFWTYVMLRIGYLQGYQKGQDDAELEVANVLLEAYGENYDTQPCEPDDRATSDIDIE